MSTKTATFTVWNGEHVVAACDTYESAKASARRVALSNGERKQFRITGNSGVIVATCDYAPNQRMKWSYGQP
jgi:hypothetical protein